MKEVLFAGIKVPVARVDISIIEKIEEETTPRQRFTSRDLSGGLFAYLMPKEKEKE